MLRKIRSSCSYKVSETKLLPWRCAFSNRPLIGDRLKQKAFDEHCSFGIITPPDTSINSRCSVLFTAKYRAYPICTYVYRYSARPYPYVYYSMVFVSCQIRVHFDSIQFINYVRTDNEWLYGQCGPHWAKVTPLCVSSDFMNESGAVFGLRWREPQWVCWIL